ncbi:MAG: carboxypeptidase regulatory-like protein [Gemmataceae bacterium]|nr:carboxypeptidase regulatory-like protein [Gemmataceae bacterium]
MPVVKVAKVLAGSVAAFALVLMVGCGDSGRSYSPTRGQVFVGGKPAEGALVTLVPVAGKDGPDARPTGMVGADGGFSLATYEAATRNTHEGALAGQYVVLITWFPQATLGSPDLAAPQVDRLGGRYRDPKTSRVAVEVKEGGTELSPIQLPATDVKGRSQ